VVHDGLGEGRWAGESVGHSARGGCGSPVRLVFCMLREALRQRRRCIKPSIDDADCYNALASRAHKS
jgi:hypothetical protein